MMEGKGLEGLEYQHDCHSQKKKASDGKVREKTDV